MPLDRFGQNLLAPFELLPILFLCRSWFELFGFVSIPLEASVSDEIETLSLAALSFAGLRLALPYGYALSNKPYSPTSQQNILL